MEVGRTGDKTGLITQPIHTHYNTISPTVKPPDSRV